MTMATMINDKENETVTEMTQQLQMKQEQKN